MAERQGSVDACSRVEEPIAIIGMACRYPGEASSPAGFWNLISNARSAHSPIPATRFNADAWYHPDPDRNGAIGVKSGFFLDEDLSLFDAPFFSITAKEANTMDPMHRWILEVAYESLENAGIPMTSLPRSDTGCYVGCFTDDYDRILTSDIFTNAPYTATGAGATMLSNRVSWFFDLRGPSMSIDTACSSGAYALHLACQSIRTGETKQAIVGGTNIMLHPSMFHALTKMRMMSPDGKCHSFDDRANGYARGEGIAAIVVKSLSAALADGDTIRAVIRGTGCNQDGRTPGITMPSALAQADLIRKTYAKAGLSLNETAYFEAHGTGTPLGDPLELSALGATFGAARSPTQPPLYVSSVKTNIGHTEGCSALAGIIKAVMSLEKGLIAPNAEFENLNPRLRLDAWKLALPPKTIPWPNNGVRRVSINSFGYGGANGHVILQDALSYFLEQNITGNHTTRSLTQNTDDDSGFSSNTSSDDEGQAVCSKKNRIFVFSTFDQSGVQRLATSWTRFLSKRLEEMKELTIGIDSNLDRYADDLAYTLSVRRTVFDHRSFIVASSLTDLQRKLSEGLPKIQRVTKNDNIIMVFTGQGAQWHQMGIELVNQPVFLKSMIRTQSVLDSLSCPWNALEELRKSKEDTRINQADFSQPLCTALQIALVDLMSHWGIKARAVVGHSSGEIGAAYAAQMISHEDAIKVAYLRGIYSASVNSRLEGVEGAMMAAGISEEEAVSYLQRITSGQAVTACINSPSSVTLSGDVSAILELEKMLKADGKFARVLKVPTAYHSHHMLVIADDYLRSLGAFQTRHPSNDAPAMFSSVTASLVKSEDLNGNYWVKNMVSPVRFSDAFKALLSHSPSTRGRRRATVSYGAMIEIGPHEALKGPLNQILTEYDSRLTSNIAYGSLLFRERPADASALDCIGKLWSHGLTVNIQRVNPKYEDRFRPRVLSDLPSYPWNHSNGFWHESNLTRSVRFKKAPRTDLLGMAVDVQNPHHPRWRQILSIHEQPWLEHHKITNTILFPAAGMFVMALEAIHEIAGRDKKLRGVEFRHVSFDRGLVIPEGKDQAVEVSLELQPHKLDNQNTTGWYNFTIFSIPNGGEWVEHCSGLVHPVHDDLDEVDCGMELKAEWAKQTETYATIRATSQKQMNMTDFYKNLESIGMGYGVLFQNLQDAYAGSKCAHGTIAIPNTKACMPYEHEYPHFIHPATLDAIFHLLFLGISSGNPFTDAAVPVNMEYMFIATDLPVGAGAKYKGYAYDASPTLRGGSGSMVLSDDAWSSPKVIVQNFTAHKVTSTDITSVAKSQRKIVTQVRWMEDVDHFQGPPAHAILQASGSVYAQLIMWLERLCHKRSDLSVVVLGRNGDDCVLDILNRFAPQVGGRRRFDSCIVLEETKDFAEATQKKLDDSEIVATVKALDLQRHLTEQQLELASFDLIIATGCDGSLLSGLANLIRPDGWMVFEQMAEIPQTLDLDRALTLASTIPDDRSMLVAPLAISNESELRPAKITILEPTTSSADLQVLKTTLARRLSSQGTQVHFATLASAKHLKDQIVISLLEAEQPAIIKFEEEQLEQFKALCASSKFLLWINRSGLQFSPTTGLLRVVRTELPQIRLPHLEISDKVSTASLTFAETVLRVFTRIFREENAEIDTEYSERDGQIFIPRLVTDASVHYELDISCAEPAAVMLPLLQADRPLKMKIGAAENFDSLVWVDDEKALDRLGDSDVEIQVTGVPLHTADTIGSMNDALLSTVGREAVGIITRVGRDVLKFKPGQEVATIQMESCRTLIRQRQDLVVPASTNLSSPLSALTAFHALKIACLTADDKLLIHSAASSVGQYAIQIAIDTKAEIFVTVNSKIEKEHLRTHYGIPEDHILSCHDMQFAKAIKRLTDGEGVDVALNTLVGEGFQQTWACVAEFGRFIDLGTKACTAAINTACQISYHRVDMDRLLDKKRAVVAKALAQVSDLATSDRLNTISPLSSFSASDAQEALTLLQGESYNGQVILEFDSKALVRMSPPKPIPLQLDPIATYFVPGGLGDLGAGVVSLMIEHGAKHVVIMSRSGAATDRQKAQVLQWQERGCRIDALRCDCTDSIQLEAVMERSRAEGWKIKGVVQLAMVLRDSPLETMTFEKWQGSIRPKIKGTWNLHNLLPKDLDFFVTFSSISNVIGNAGQANYCAANAYQDALCRYRRSMGMQGTSISVGLMSDVEKDAAGNWLEFLRRHPHLEHVQTKEHEILTVLKACMKGTTSDGVPVPSNIITGMSDDLENGRDGGTPTAIWATDRKFELLQKPSCEKSSQSTNSTNANKPNITAQLVAAASFAEASAAVEFAICCNIAASMCSTPEDIDREKPMHAYGVDSLKAVDVRNWIFREIKTEVSVFDILSQMSITKLAAKIAAHSKLVKEEVSRHGREAWNLL